MDRHPLDLWLRGRMGLPSPNVQDEYPPSRADLQSWQLGQLRRLVAHAQGASPFYADHLRGVDPAALRTLDDFARLPFLTPDHIRSAPEQLLCVSQDEIARVVTLRSSGTTGQPKRIFHTEDDLEATRDFFHWGMSAMVRPGETALVLLPGDRPDGVGRLLTDALARMGARAVAYGVLEDVDHALDRCRAEQARCIVGSPAHVHLLARLWERRGLPLGEIRSVLLCWDAIPDAVRQTTARAFGCRVFRHWGMIETGLGGAVECQPGSGMHLRETDVFLEITDPDTGAPLPDGAFGEMVLTTPLRRGMPLLRYRTGDRGRILPGQCDCGSPLRRLDSRVQRLDDGVATPAGRLTIRELGERLYAVPGLGDFSAAFDGQALRIRACGHGLDPAALRAALQTIPTVESGCAQGWLALDIELACGLAPAVPGLGKRRIQTPSEK